LYVLEVFFGLFLLYFCLFLSLFAFCIASIQLDAHSK
jgi:hypothetical protein